MLHKRSLSLRCFNKSCFLLSQLGFLYLCRVISSTTVTNSLVFSYSSARSVQGWLNSSNPFRCFVWPQRYASIIRVAFLPLVLTLPPRASSVEQWEYKVAFLHVLWVVPELSGFTERPVQSTSASLSLLSLGGKSQKYSILRSPFTSCFQHNRASSFVGELNNYSPLSRNANLLQCPACPSGLLLPARPFHVWQSISPRHQSTASPPGRAPGALWEISAAVFPSKRRQQDVSSQLGPTIRFTFW